MQGSTPAAYGAWLAAACERMLAESDPQHRIVFINAWNEWAEGAHLEPDRHFGHAYLAETSRVVARLAGLSPEALRDVVTSAPVSTRAPRRLSNLPRLVVKNILYHAANAAFGLAKRLRRMM